ncbi:MAG: TIGR02206 family membrane protein [Chthoniobacterales bacterium]
MAGNSFQLFSPPHLVAIAITFVAPFALAAAARRSPRIDRITRATIAILLALNFIGYGIRACFSGSITWQQALPFQLCDWTMVAVIVACWNGGKPRWLEVIYFWAIGGSLQAVLTPNLQFGFPDYRFLTFFIDHCCIVIGTAYLMITRRFRPTFASIWRTWLWSIVYLFVTLAIDHLTNVNYGFLLHKPEAFSILSYLSDARPVYIFQLNLLALMFFAILYLPFALYDLARSSRTK